MITRRTGLLAALLLATLGVVLPTGTGQAATPHVATNVTINGADTGRTLDGVGAISGGGGNSRLLADYPEPQRSQVLDYLFKPGYGAAVQVLKVEVGGDTNSTSGAEPSHQHTATDLDCDRGYEWWLMEQAEARNPNIRFAALSWGAPGWVGSTFWTQQTIDYLVRWLDCAKNTHGLTISYLGGWNERGHDKTWYEQLRSTLNARGYGGVKVVADDTNFGVADDVVTDPAFAAAVDVLGAHYPCGYRGSQSNCPSSTNALATGKPLWASENGSDDDVSGAPALARGINRGYLDGKMTGYLNWPIVASAYPNLPYPSMGVAVADQPWSGAYSIGQNAWVMAQTTQFTAPGWRYLDGASGFLGGDRANGSYVTLRSPSSGDYSTVVETVDATAAQTFSAAVTGGLATGPVHVWATKLGSANPADQLAHVTDVTPSGGAFSVTLQPGYVYTLTTTTGQGRGTATSPAAGTLPLPYSDGFDTVRTGAEARYLADQQGAFEVRPCGGGRSGQCVRQMSPQAPVTWDTISDPYALLGDLSWVNYRVSADLLLEQAGYAELIGRAVAQHAFGPAGLNAYYLRVADTGAWSVFRNNTDNSPTTLASGTTTALGTGSWHTAALTFSGSTITATLDGRTLATVTDGTWTVGQVGLGTAQAETAQFDNLAVTPVSGPTPVNRLVGYGSERCLDVPNQTQTNGTQVDIWSCDGGANQQWAAQSSGALQVYGGKCLDASGHGTAPGTAVIIWDCTGGANQQWRIGTDGTIRGVESGLCLDVTGGGTSNGSLAELWTCTGGTNQQWHR